MNNSIKKISSILRTDQDNIAKVQERLSEVTGKRNILDKLMEENERQISEKLDKLGVARDAKAKEVYDALTSKIEADDKRLSEIMGNPISGDKSDCSKVLAIVKGVISSQRGFFLKEDKAKEFLVNIPPENVMRYLGYDSPTKMLEEEDLYEVFSSLRFLEDSEWLNNTFFKQYESLKPDDFEERDIIVKALGEKWNKAADSFIEKKWHNISHLKEMGIVFVIPRILGISGGLLRMVSLVLHYLNEIPFYSDMFKQSTEVPDMFAQKVVSLLKGESIDRKMIEGEKSLWLVIQRYLAKEDENDWRLFVPHLNPEALHWMKAERDLVKIGDSLNHFGESLRFWNDLDWVGDYFKDDSGHETLVSFDLVDTVMSLVKEKELIKYLYHHQEALWNKIFIEYFGEEKLEYFMKRYLLQGYFEI
jgi:hypothetical protein